MNNKHNNPERDQFQAPDGAEIALWRWPQSKARPTVHWAHATGFHGPVPPHVPGQDIDVRGKLIKEGAVQAAMETRCMRPVQRGARFGLRPAPQCDVGAIRRDRKSVV